MDSYASWIIGISFIVLSFAYVCKWWKERQLLMAKIKDITGRRSDFNNIESITAIKRFLTESISYDIARREAKRPLLRQTAAKTLQTGFGFCGENARVAVLMLNYSGIRAGRVYLIGQHWNHVVVENLFNGQWFLFDAHRDPGVLLPDNLVCKIPINEISLFPNEYRKQNEWVKSCRIKIAQKVEILSWLAHWRLPKPLTILSESPDLIKATLLLMTGFTILIITQIL